ncbi:hypothetical protein [Streptomyces lavendulae]|uniref:hypothetical protein n=1 Tax=Streptomyces lavendulae TaxID=1914 RepID=UPI0024A3596B|nr:hypothetical protein [Streptomyces lavendulae]GLW04713.1 hypothetical protein Slala05_83430 [Streptomyces lavendulae subsp. lavendulae]
MSTEQHYADAYGQELARISHHQHEATAARFTVFQAEEPTPAPAVALDAKDVLAAAERFLWALPAPGTRHWPDGEFLDVALGAVRTEEREGCIKRLEAFV